MTTLKLDRSVLFLSILRICCLMSLIIATVCTASGIGGTSLRCHRGECRHVPVSYPIQSWDDLGEWELPGRWHARYFIFAAEIILLLATCILLFIRVLKQENTNVALEVSILVTGIICFIIICCLECWYYSYAFAPYRTLAASAVASVFLFICLVLYIVDFVVTWSNCVF